MKNLFLLLILLCFSMKPLEVNAIWVSLQSSSEVINITDNVFPPIGWDLDTRAGYIEFDVTLLGGFRAKGLAYELINPGQSAKIILTATDATIGLRNLDINTQVCKVEFGCDINPAIVGNINWKVHYDGEANDPTPGEVEIRIHFLEGYYNNSVFLAKVEGQFISPPVPPAMQPVIINPPDITGTRQAAVTSLRGFYYMDPRPGDQIILPSSATVEVSTEPILPVELSLFSSVVNGKNVELKWTTLEEFNNSGFDIERKSDNARMWNKVGFVPGEGTVSSMTNYGYEDRSLSSGRYNYRLKQIDFNGNFQYFDLQNEVVIGIPEKFSLSQNYPNPFNPTTKIDFELPKDGNVKLSVFDNSGRLVSTVLNEYKSAGYYSVEFNGSNLASGVYFYKLETAGDNRQQFIAVKKMVVLK